MKSLPLRMALWIAFVAVPAMAQQGPGGGGGPGGPGGGQGGPPDPAEMRQRMLDGIKEQVNVSDAVWKALEPKIVKVIDLRRSINPRPGGGPGGPGGGPGGPGGPPGRDDEADETPLLKARHDLEDVLDKDNASNEDVRAKTEAYRKAKDDAKAELLKAQKELRDGLDARTEAELTLRGLFD